MGTTLIPYILRCLANPYISFIQPKTLGTTVYWWTRHACIVLFKWVCACACVRACEYVFFTSTYKYHLLLTPETNIFIIDIWPIVTFTCSWEVTGVIRWDWRQLHSQPGCCRSTAWSRSLGHPGWHEGSRHLLPGCSQIRPHLTRTQHNVGSVLSWCFPCHMGDQSPWMPHPQDLCITQTTG